MASNNLKAYLAERYMSGAKADAILARSSTPTESGDEPKRKKRKVRKELQHASTTTAQGSGIGVVDEDEFGGFRNADEEEEDGADVPVVAEGVKEFRKKTGGWVRGGDGAAGSGVGEGRDRIDGEEEELGSSSTLAAAAAAPPPPPSKKRGGLLTAADLALEIEQQRADAAQAAAALKTRRLNDDNMDEDEDEAPNPHETIHRDATGAKIDPIALQQAEQTRLATEARKAAEKAQWSRGLVQRREKEEKTKREQGMAREDVARYADDAQMNEEMRGVERADDPMAGYLTKRKAKGPQRPKYTGPPAPPNRFNILPGYRWDGVDRSTGYEAKLFQATNNRRRRVVEANAWSMEDM
ncbi:hypothetical protein QFC21_002883 [Naganishia friedmannii]|uniref:Uncharacterized protein n=1 Tax=Naganishia friedmannii TaxID=89922 RepID=A0ACC2VTP0_9TREE|nr:hypothetical protein QFC21_002883 [Naganishia friedmannii]